MILKFKFWLAKRFGFRFTATGIVESYRLTFGGAGNQLTMIGGREYATYWDFRSKDWSTGDLVRFEVFYEPLLGRHYPQLQATAITKV